MERTARCHCRALRAITTGDPAYSNLCHCRACQKRTGAIVHAGAFFSGQNVRVEGISKVYIRVGDTGFAVHFHFCPACGTSVYWISDRQPDKLGVAVGCFADSTFPVPTHSVWEESKHPWLGLPSGMVHQKWGFNPDGTPMTR